MLEGRWLMPRRQDVPVVSASPRVNQERGLPLSLGFPSDCRSRAVEWKPWKGGCGLETFQEHS